MVNDFPLKFFPRFAFDQFVKPQYSSYNFANIHHSVLKLFDVATDRPVLPKDCFGDAYPSPRVVVTFFIDAFGWRFWADADPQLKAIERIKQDGRLTPLTTLFPSTTAASITTFHTGVLPAEHALFEWNLYTPEYDEIIQSLAFCPVGDKDQDKLLELGYDPSQLYNLSETLVAKLESAGVKTTVFTPRDYSESAYNQMIGRGGGSVQGYRQTTEALAQIKETVRQIEGKNFLFFYTGEIDAVMHEHGPDSDQAKLAIANFWNNFEQVFGQWEKPEDVLFLFIADHGHISSNEADGIYLNQLVPEISDYLKTHKDGRPIRTTGATRDVFLHVKPESVEEAVALLREKLDMKALVLTTSDALEQGLFGSGPFNQRFLDRLGQVIILPYEGQQIWWYDPPNWRIKHKGNHGGLSPEEAITAIAVW